MHQAAFSYLRIIHLAPYQGQCCCKALARRMLSTASCATAFFLRDLQREVGLHGKSLLPVSGTDLRGKLLHFRLMLLLRALSLIGLPSPCGDATCLGDPAAFKGILENKDFLGKQALKSCMGALTFSIGHHSKGCQPPCSANLLCIFQHQSLLSTGLCIQSDECGNSDCMTWW